MKLVQVLACLVMLTACGATAPIEYTTCGKDPYLLLMNSEGERVQEEAYAYLYTMYTASTESMRQLLKHTWARTPSREGLFKYGEKVVLLREGDISANFVLVQKHGTDRYWTTRREISCGEVSNAQTQRTEQKIFS